MSRKKTTNLSIPIFKPSMRCTKILLLLNENDNNSNLRKITFQNFQNLVNMGLGVNISFNQFLSNLQLLICFIMYNMKTNINVLKT
jgi:hypothetical protein